MRILLTHMFQLYSYECKVKCKGDSFIGTYIFLLITLFIFCFLLVFGTSRYETRGYLSDIIQGGNL